MPPSDRKLRVLHVHQRAAFMGGVEQIMFDTARSLAEAGWPQGLLHAGDSSPDPEFCRVFSATGSSPAEMVERFKPDVLLVHKLEDAEMVGKLAEMRPAVRMVHDHDLVCLRRHKYFPVGSGICNKPAGIDCYTHLCFVQKASAGSWFPIRFKSVRAQQKLLEANRSLRYFIVGSRWMRDELLVNGMSPSAVRIIHPIPKSLENCHELPATRQKKILFVGQVIRGKGVDLMLRALAKLTGPWQATVVGAGNHLDFCKSLAADLGIAESVAFTGWVDHDRLVSFYGEALFTVVPSRWPEPFGMVGVEAMARGRAVVAFDVGGIPDWLDHERSGLLAHEADADGLAAQMQRFLDRPEFAAELGSHAARMVRERFRHTAYIEQMMSLLGSAI